VFLELSVVNFNGDPNRPKSRIGFADPFFAVALRAITETKLSQKETTTSKQ
jgi:hypothetical protein